MDSLIVSLSSFLLAFPLSCLPLPLFSSLPFFSHFLDLLIELEDLKKEMKERHEKGLVLATRRSTLEAALKKKVLERKQRSSNNNKRSNDGENKPAFVVRRRLRDNDEEELFE